MCCEKCNIRKGNGDIALSFSQNQLPIAAVFVKYGMGHMEPTPENALIGSKAFGYNFIKEVSLAAAGVNPAISNYTPAEQAELAANIFQIFGAAADTGVNIAQGIADIKNGNRPQQTNTETGQPIAYTPPPAEPARIGGFTTNQLGVLLLAGALVIGVLLYFNNQGQKG